MGLIFGRVKLQESLGSTATTFSEEIKFGHIVDNLIVNSYCLKLTASAATVQNLVDKIDQFRITTENGDPESTIDGDDLHEFPKYSLGLHPFVSKLTSTDNIPHAVSYLYPFSTFPRNFRAPYGLPAFQGVQMQYDTAADTAGDFDNFTTDVLTEGVTADVKTGGGTNGYIKFVRDAYTSGAVDETHETRITGKKLLGVYNFMTTSFDDLAASAAINVTGIREQQVTKSDATVIRYKPFESWATRPNNTLSGFDAIAGDATDNTDILDDGRWFQNLGIQNIPAGIVINDNPRVEIKTTAGVAEATRLYGVVLV